MIEKNNITNKFLYFGVKRFFDLAFAILLITPFISNNDPSYFFNYHF